MIAALLQAAQPAPAERPSWATFSRGSSLVGHVPVTVRVGTARRLDGESRAEYWFERRERLRDGSTRTSSTETRRCPGAREELGAMAALQPPRFAPPGIDSDRLEFMLDGIGYELSASSRYGRISGGPMAIRSNIGTPLQRWVDRMLAVLEPCWRSEQS